MPSRDQVAYFGAGPAGLPSKAITKAAEAFVNFEDSGLGLAEISHRSSTATKILTETKASLRELMSIPEEYEIIFAHGGGSGVFSSVVYNLVAHWAEKHRKQIISQDSSLDEASVRAQVVKAARSQLKLDYIVSGSWSLKASQEAADLTNLIGSDIVNVVTDGRKFTENGKFTNVPLESEWKLTPTAKEGGTGSAFVYYCDNETVDGVEFPSFPNALAGDDRLVVADMSSNILTRNVDVSRYAAIFAGMQKNVGITDTTIIIVRKAILEEQVPKSYLIPTPVVMHWPTLAKHDSLYNTLPIFSLFVAGSVMKDLLAVHGPLSSGSQAKLSQEKAKAIYDVLDANPELFQVCPESASRSRMNICFRINGGDEALEKKFVTGAEQWNLLGVKGHRSVGGIRVSNYNAVSLEAMQKLEAYMLDFTHSLKAQR